jgi:hypothetical protein
MRTLLLAFIVGFLSFQAPQQAHACSCAMPGSLQESIDIAEVIFSGTIEDIRVESEWEFAVSITVDEEWKGLSMSERQELTIYTASNSAACGYTFKEGEEYLVYGYRNAEGGKVNVGLCSATKPLDQAEEDLALLSGDGQWACTMDAKMCPDGSYVGRQGPTCEFAPCPDAEDAPFTDVHSNHPNVEAIAYVKSQGIVEGYSDGTYRPDATINRAEFVKILMGTREDDQRMCKIAAFSDVDQTAWYATYAHKARCNGLVQGYPDGTFRPANSINFVEAAKILMHAYPFPYDEPQEGDPWYKGYVQAIASQGVIPLSITRFDQYITRGEMAEMIYRLQRPSEWPSRTYDELR